MEYYWGCIGNLEGTEEWQEVFSEKFPSSLLPFLQKPFGPIYQTIDKLQEDITPTWLFWAPPQLHGLPYYVIGYFGHFSAKGGDRRKLCTLVLPDELYKSHYHSNPFHILRSDFLVKLWQKAPATDEFRPLPTPQPLPDASEDIRRFIKDSFSASLEAEKQIVFSYSSRQIPLAMSFVECIFSTLPKERVNNVSFITACEEAVANIAVLGQLSDTDNEQLTLFAEYPSPLPTTDKEPEQIEVPQPALRESGTEYIALPSSSLIHPELLDSKEEAPAIELLDSLALPLPTAKVAAKKEGKGVARGVLIAAGCFLCGILTMVLVSIFASDNSASTGPKLWGAKVKESLLVTKDFQQRLEVSLQDIAAQGGSVPYIELLQKIAIYRIGTIEQSRNFWQQISGELFLHYPEIRGCLVSLLEKEQHQILRNYENFQGVTVEKAREVLQQLQNWEKHWQQANQNLDNDALILDENRILKNKYGEFIATFESIEKYQIGEIVQARDFWRQALKKIVAFPESQQHFLALLDKEKKQILEQYQTPPQKPTLVEVQRTLGKLDAWRQHWQEVDVLLGKKFVEAPYREVYEKYSTLATKFQEVPQDSDEETLQKLTEEWLPLPLKRDSMVKILQSEDARQQLKALAEASASFLYKWQKIEADKMPKSRDFYSKRQQERDAWYQPLEKLAEEIAEARRQIEYPQTIEQFATQKIDYVVVSEERFNKLLAQYQTALAKKLEEFSALLQGRQSFGKISQISQILPVWQLCQAGLPYFERKPQYPEQMPAEQKQLFIAVYRQRKQRFEELRQKVLPQVTQYRPLVEQLQNFDRAWQDVLLASSRHEKIELASWPEVDSFSAPVKAKLNSFLAWLKQPGKTRGEVAASWSDIFLPEFVAYLRHYQQIDELGITPQQLAQVLELKLVGEWFRAYLLWLNDYIARYLDEKFQKAFANLADRWWQGSQSLAAGMQQWQDELTQWQKALRPPMKAEKIEELRKKTEEAGKFLAQLEKIKGESERKWWLSEDKVFAEYLQRIEKSLSSLNDYIASRKDADVEVIIKGLQEKSKELQQILQDLQKLTEIPQLKEKAMQRQLMVQKFSTSYDNTINSLQKFGELKHALQLPTLPLEEMQQLQELYNKHKDLLLFSANLHHAAVEVRYPKFFLARTSADETSFMRDASLETFEKNRVLHKIEAMKNQYRQLKNLLRTAQEIKNVFATDFPSVVLNKPQIEALLRWSKSVLAEEGPSFLKDPGEVKKHLFSMFRSYTRNYKKKDQQSNQKQDLRVYLSKGVAFYSSSPPKSLPPELIEYINRRRSELDKVEFVIKYAVLGKINGGSRPISIEELQFYKETERLRSQPIKWYNVELSSEYENLGMLSVRWRPFLSEQFYASKHLFRDWPFMAKSEFPIPWAFRATLLVAPVKITE